MPDITLLHGDCLELMPTIETGSVDLVLTDPPYGTTACKWDSIIPLEPMWENLKRLRKERAAVVMTASQPFTTTLISSNMKEFKYCWVWEKGKASGHLNSKKMPLKKHEDVAVFCSNTYNPQGLIKGGFSTSRSGDKTKVYGKQSEYCLLYTSPSPRDKRQSRMPSSA